jgi:plasmid stabilization system protein ParE
MPRAERDIDSIFAWLGERSPAGASNRLAALDAIFQRIATEPNSFATALEAKALGSNLKQGLFKTPKGRSYRAVFLFENEMVFILRVRGPGQPPLQDDELASDLP